MTIHLNTPAVRSDICAKRTNLAELRVLVAALLAATVGLHSGWSQAAESAGPPAMAPLAAPPAAKGQIARFQSPPGGRSACSGLFATPLAQPPGRAWWQRLPARYDGRALPRLHVVRDAGKQPAQLDRGRQLALLLECSADCGGFRFGHDEHAGSMVTRGVTGKLPDLSRPSSALQHPSLSA